MGVSRRFNFSICVIDLSAPCLSLTHSPESAVRLRHGTRRVSASLCGNCAHSVHRPRTLLLTCPHNHRGALDTRACPACLESAGCIESALHTRQPGDVAKGDKKRRGSYFQGLDVRPQRRSRVSACRCTERNHMHDLEK